MTPSSIGASTRGRRISRSGRRLLAGLFVLVASAIVLPSAYAETRFALLVGHNLGMADEVPLRWAESDAIRMRNLLTEIGNVHPDRAILLKSPTPKDFDQAYARLQGAIDEASRRGESTVLIFYFSGHADARALHFGLDGLPLAELEGELASIGADTVLSVLDACRNDRTPRALTKGATRAPAFAWPAGGPATPKGYVRLTSVAEGEVAQESDDLQGSLFSHYLLTGMRGSADFDGDGVVTLSEIYRHGYRRTLEATHREATAVQHSELDVKLTGRGELIVTYPRRAGAHLVFGDDAEGHWLVVDDASGRIVAELEQRPGQQQRLAIASGRYRLQLRAARTFRTGLVNATEGDYRVRPSELEAQATLAVLRKGAAYDPRPLTISIGTGIARSAVEGFGWAPMATLGFGWRIASPWRIAAQGFASVSEADSEVWTLQQVEWGGSLGIDWLAYRGAQLDWLIGIRGGVVGVVQSGSRRDASRLQAAGVDDVALTLSNSTFGPEAAARTALEYHPWTRVGFRLSVEPSIRWLSVDGQADPRIGLNVFVAGLFRL